MTIHSTDTNVDLDVNVGADVDADVDVHSLWTDPQRNGGIPFCGYACWHTLEKVLL